MIAKREFLEKVRKRAFLIMTILGPVFFGILMIVPVWIAAYNPSSSKKIAVIDEVADLSLKLPESEKYTFLYLNTGLDMAKKLVIEGEYDALLHIPAINIDNPKGITLFTPGNISLDLQQQIEWKLNTEIEELRLKNSGIDPQLLKKIKPDISVNTINISSEGEEKNNTTASAGAGLGAAVLIYLFIFMYGIQVMRGVIEEKTNRIVEVIITSVKPIELMAGKILGIASVAFLQFLLWIVLTFTIASGLSARFQINRFSDANFSETLAKTQDSQMQQAMEMHNIVSAIESLNLPYLIMAFAFYFLVGYLLYAAMFAAIGSAVDNETDTQQFMFPVTIPLVLAFVFAQTIIRSPDGNLAFWLSMIPFTSPIIMLVRLPFGVPAAELVLSMIILMASTWLLTWLSARIYRTGILMYGKKATLKELGKWLFY